MKADKCIKLMKVLRKYLFHIQNSVFEGELTAQSKENLINEISKTIDKKDGNVLIYTLPSDKPLKKQILGNPKLICKTII